MMRIERIVRELSARLLSEEQLAEPTADLA